MTDQPDADLVARAQRSDANAIGALYDLHHQAIFRYFRARVGQTQTAEDLTGEVFRRMLTGLPQYRPVGLPFRAWLFRIAHNLLVDHLRQESSSTTIPLDQTEGRPAGEGDPASIAEHNLTLAVAYQALTALETLQREVIILRFLSGLSLRETALALNKTEDAIKALQRRGLLTLRLTLAEE